MNNKKTQKNKKSSFSTLYLKHIGKGCQIELRMLNHNKLKSVHFYNLNFNLHHLCLRWYSIANRVEQLSTEGWLILDTQYDDNYLCLGNFEIGLETLNNLIREQKRICSKDYVAHTKSLKRLRDIEAHRDFLDKVKIMYGQELSRSSINQLNRTFNQQTLLANSNFALFPIKLINLESIFNNIFKHLLDSVIWFGGLQQNNFIASTPLTTEIETNSTDTSFFSLLSETQTELDLIENI